MRSTACPPKGEDVPSRYPLILQKGRQGKVALNLKGFFFTPWDLVQNWKPNIFYQIE